MMEEVVEVQEVRATPAFREALRSLDEVNLEEVFQRRATVLKTIPACLRGPCRNAMKVILDEIVAGWESSDMPRQERGWKALL